jgi:flagellar hook-basal body complex protein FliE
MSAEQFIAPVTAVREPALLSALAPATGQVDGANATAGFGAMVTSGIEQVNQQLLTSQTQLQDLGNGKVENLHQVMLHLEESRISFQLMLQVRNRLLESYQDLMRMQV